jgi:CDP-diacylglycerol---glycerol-3-phosphate 3-phosphatidyltransferase
MSRAISNLHQPNEVLLRLKKRWAAFTFIGMVTLVSSALLLHTLWESKFALRWLAISVTGMFYLTGILWRNLDQNHRPGENYLLPVFGPGNSLTLLRGVLLAGLAGFIFLPPPEKLLAWSPAIIYTLAITADYLDGFAARVSNHVTRLGETLDMSLDGVGVMIASILAIQYGTLPIWYLMVPVARYFFLVGISYRKRRGLPVYSLNPSLRRKAFAGLQMGFLSAMLWPIFTPPGTTLAAFVFALPFLIGFVIDWFGVSGLLRQNNNRQTGAAFTFLLTWVPIALRMAVLIAILPAIGGEVDNVLAQFVQATDQVRAPATLSIILFGAEIMVLFFLVLGAAGRVAAIAGLLLLGIHQIHVDLNFTQYLLIFVYVAILYVGTGKYSLWKPEERLIFNQAGRAHTQVVERYPTTPIRQ